MRQKSIIYSGHVEVVEYPAVPAREAILAKPIYVYIGDVERSVVQGAIPVTRPVVLGSTGIAKVVEVFEGSTEPTGKVYTVSPLGDRGFLGVNTNGLLSNYASLTHAYLDEELTQSNPHDSLRPLVKHASEIASTCEEPVLIEGCGIIGVAAGLALRKAGVEPVFYCENGARRAHIFNFNVHKHVGDLSSKWRTVVITSMDPGSKYTVLAGFEYYNVVITPLSFTRWLPLPASRVGSVKVLTLWKTGKYSSEFVRDVLRELSKVVRIVAVDDIEKVLGLIPPRGFGFIIAFKS